MVQWQAAFVRLMLRSCFVCVCVCACVRARLDLDVGLHRMPAR